LGEFWVSVVLVFGFGIWGLGQFSVLSIWVSGEFRVWAVWVLVLGFGPLALLSSSAMLVASSSIMMHSLAWLYHAKCIS
jgi:hypothetical protein